MVDESKAAQSEPASGQAGAGSTGSVAGVDATPDPTEPGFLERGGLRRRLRFLRKTRELAYRDLGGLVFEMHRLGQRREDLLAGKLATLQHIDTELRAIEETLHQRHGVTVLREAGVTACPRCAAIHGSEDRFCPACGFSMGSHAERPIAASPVATPVSASSPGVASAQPGGYPAVSQPANATPLPSQGAHGTPQPANAQSANAAPQPASATPQPANSTPPANATPAPPAPAHRPLSGPAGQPPRPLPVTPAPAPPDADQPTQVIEPPTQIVRPASGEPPAEKSNRA